MCSCRWERCCPDALPGEKEGDPLAGREPQGPLGDRIRVSSRHRRRVRSYARDFADPLRCAPFTWTKDPDTVIAKATDPAAARHQRRQIRSTRALTKRIVGRLT